MTKFDAAWVQAEEAKRELLKLPFEQLATYSGRIALAYDLPIVILCVSVWAIARGSDCVSGELGRGTMEMLLAQPVSRLQVLLTQATVTTIGCHRSVLLALIDRDALPDSSVVALCFVPSITTVA